MNSNSVWPPKGLVVDKDLSSSLTKNHLVHTLNPAPIQKVFFLYYVHFEPYAHGRQAYMEMAWHSLPLNFSASP